MSFNQNTILKDTNYLILNILHCHDKALHKKNKADIAIRVEALFEYPNSDDNILSLNNTQYNSKIVNYLINKMNE